MANITSKLQHSVAVMRAVDVPARTAEVIMPHRFRLTATPNSLRMDSPVRLIMPRRTALKEHIRRRSSSCRNSRLSGLRNTPNSPLRMFRCHRATTTPTMPLRRIRPRLSHMLLSRPILPPSKRSMARPTRSTFNLDPRPSSGQRILSQPRIPQVISVVEDGVDGHSRTKARPRAR